MTVLINTDGRATMCNSPDPTMDIFNGVSYAAEGQPCATGVWKEFIQEWIIERAWIYPNMRRRLLITTNRVGSERLSDQPDLAVLPILIGNMSSHET